MRIRSLNQSHVSGVAIALLVLMLAVATLGPVRTQQTHQSTPVAVASESGSDSYAYGSAPFLQLVRDSYGQVQGREASEFTRWIEQAYRRSGTNLSGEKLGLDESLSALARNLACTQSGDARAYAEMEIAARLHSLIKQIIPRFSLDRGYEFHNVVQYGERQCLLQSVLITSMLQKIGINAGVVMVFRNDHGELSNNGHAVVLMKLSNGQDILVDASHAEPFPRLQGLLVRAPNYQYVSPVYSGASSTITRYRPVANSNSISPSHVWTLNYAYLRSQFWYYRGERAVGGVLAAHPTAAGLAASTRFLRQSISLCPQNALAVYMLGRSYLAQGDTAQARALLSRSNAEYARCGWVPDGPRQYLATARGHTQARG